jgi:heme/copper-type cytochrome/quinol oxidase subunit 4
MKVTRDVMNDLLPLYFSGEASDDTRALVEEYFRENPEFERMARGAAKPLDTLKVAAWPGLLPSAEREKQDLKKVHKEMWRRKVVFGLALFFTLAPLAFVYSKGHITWMMFRNEPWDAGFYWSFGAFLWVVYFARLSQRTISLVAAIFFALFPAVMHFAFPGGPHIYTKAIPNWTVAFLWGVAVLAFLQFLFRLRRRTASLLFAIFLTVFPLSVMLYSVLTGSNVIMGWGNPAFFWTLAAFLWFQYFRLRRKPDSDC